MGGWGTKVMIAFQQTFVKRIPEGVSTRNLGYMKKFVMADLSLIMQHPVA
jgi:hypothetical protein